MRGALCVGLLLLALGLLPSNGTPRAYSEEDQRLRDFQAVVETAKRKVYPALVFVKPVQEDLSDGEVRRVEILGSGVIFRPDGYVVTNHHVAEKAREIRCVLEDRRQVEAEVVGLDYGPDYDQEK